MIVLIFSKDSWCESGKWNCSKGLFRIKMIVKVDRKNSFYPGQNARHQEWWYSFDCGSLERILWRKTSWFWKLTGCDVVRIVSVATRRSHQENPCKDSEWWKTIFADFLGSCQKTADQSVSLGTSNATNHKRNCQSIVFPLFNANNGILLQTNANKCLQKYFYFIYCHRWQLTILFLWLISQKSFAVSLLLHFYIRSKNRHRHSSNQTKPHRHQVQNLFRNHNFMTTTNETLYTIKEVVDNKLLWYRERTIRQLIKEGKLWFVDISWKGSIRRIIRIPKSSIDAFLKERTR